MANERSVGFTGWLGLNLYFNPIRFRAEYRALSYSNGGLPKNALSRHAMQLLLIANPVCDRICISGNGRGYEGTWQVGFESAAACLATLLAHPIYRWPPHGGWVIQAGPRRGATCP